MGNATHGPRLGTSRLAGIDTLAQELRLPAEQVQRAYLEEVSRLEADARIKTFVAVIALGAVRARLRPQQPDR
jgi:Protein of unknown function (DUF3562)